MNCFFKFLFFLPIFLYSFEVDAQEPSYIHYRLDRNLSGAEVYQSIQDENGYLWFGTDKGLVRYDGYDFKTYTTEDGLGSNVVFGFYRDSLRGRIWMYTLKGGISYLKEGKIYTPYYNEQLVDSLGKTVISSMHIELDGTIWLASKHGAKIYKISDNVTIEKISVKKNYSSRQCFYVESNLYINTLKRGQSGIISPDSIFLRRKDKDIFINARVGESYTKGRGFCGVKLKEKIYLARGRDIIAIQESKVLQQALLPMEVTMGIYVDRRQDLWVGGYKNGVICYSGGDLEKRKFHLLKHYSVSSILEDREGGLWFTTLYSGIFYIPHLSLKSVKYKKTSQTEHNISAIEINDTSVLLGTKEGALIQQERPIKAENHRVLYSGLNEVRFLAAKSGQLFIGTRYNTHLGIVDPVQKNHHLIYARTYFELEKENSIWFTRGKAFEEDKIPIEVKFASSNFSYPNPDAICKWKGRFYAGGGHSIKVSDECCYSQWKPYYTRKKIDVTAFLPLKNHLLVGTKINGLMIHHEDSTWFVDTRNGLISDEISDMLAQNDSVFWLASPSGLSKIVIDLENYQVKVTNITTYMGLLSNKVNSLSYANDTLWVGTKLGLTYFDVRESFVNDISPKIFLNSFEVNNKERTFEPLQTFDYNQKAFSFDYVALNFKSGGKIKYKYRLNGFDDTWKETYDREQRFLLSAGEYQFEVMAQNNNGVWSHEPARFSFQVRPPIWKETWVVVVLIIFCILMIYYALNWRLNRLNEKSLLEVKMAQSQHQALSAQLKPHFVFNALNSVNSFIRKNEIEASSDYLAIFSTLIRQILTNSGNPLITLNEEISMIEKYLQIEQLRFKKQMTYEINVSTEINPLDIKVPNQLIQPYVENSIWHGIMNKTEPGHIFIEFYCKNEELFCVIEDDGIGRVAAGALSNSKFGHISKGTKINAERLQLIEAIYKLPVSIQTIDLKDQELNPCGTKVILTLPLIKA